MVQPLIALHQAMNTYLGLDLGTSVLKATIISDTGEILAANAKEIHIESPKKEFAEESPSVWWDTFNELLKRLESDVDFSSLKGVGLSGQMHGLVCYDDNFSVIRPAIIWADKRSTQQVEEVLQTITSEKVYDITGNPIFTGFLLPSLLWLKEHEPQTFNKLAKISSPKDFLALQLTENLKCEPTDALATGCFDYAKNDWSEEILKKMDIKRSLFPDIIPTTQAYGVVSFGASKKTGLPAGIPVFGGSDQSMAAMGAGLIEEGNSLLAISTGGQFLVVRKKGSLDAKRRLHTLNHAIDGVSISMAATLAAGLSMKWFKTKIMDQLDSAYDTFIQGIDNIPPGSDGLIYLPFLAGERTPYFNANLRGAFIGQTLNHTRYHFIRAIMEGVAFSFREGLESFRENGVQIDRITLSGGGTKNATWRQIITNVLNIPTQMINIDDHSPFGAAVYAKFAQEGFNELPAFYKKTISANRHLNPHKATVEMYDKLFQEYRQHAEYLNKTYRHNHG